ncbi:uncharacterized protein (TIGR03581 family) [Gracilibacillus halotolerans]|uniref:Uncharacterized protein (TIGR03581 family) n=1 Tax=Gracilibacillus halotolerans TaxID=74386 RepID=A0A841RJ65_9BACI|nr:KDGP aldolase [Gracilibacillus halotolerans]MBB6514300.1 uncharacterized protein (TIGR03581 family) [Gracilibacillus halotolerans]
MTDYLRHFYKKRVALNVLANSIDNAKQVYAAAEQYVFIGLLSKDYPNVEEAVQDMKEYGKEIEDAVSIGLGAGDSRQGYAVADIANEYAALHINQVFPLTGYTRAKAKRMDCWINALVSPTGKAGYVNLSTGPESENIDEKAIVPIKTAITFIREMGGNSIKFFPMNGLVHEDEYREVAKACAEEQFALEPTGGIDLNNFKKIVAIALEAGVPFVIPHVYSSIIDKNTGATRVEDVKELLQITKKLVNDYE